MAYHHDTPDDDWLEERDTSAGSPVISFDTPQRSRADSGTKNSHERVIFSQGVKFVTDVSITRTPIMLAAEQNDIEQFKSLLKEVDPNVDDEDGWTPLHWAVRYSNVDLVKMLLEAKASVEAKNENGQTPLHLAVDKYEGNIEIVKLLLKSGANPNARDRAHMTPYEIATLEESEDIAKLLWQENADPATTRKAVQHVGTSLRAMRVMNRARTKLQVSYHDSHGRITHLELGPGNAERIPVNCELLMRAKAKKRSSPQSSEEVSEDRNPLQFQLLKIDRRVLICNLRSSVVSGMQCMVYVTPKDHPQQSFSNRLNMTHAGSLSSRRVHMSSDAKKMDAFKNKNESQAQFRMICIGSWGENEDPSAEAYRLFTKYALHQQGKSSFRSNTMKARKSSTFQNMTEEKEELQTE
mmetsp:Transcript_12021/g.29586  ORF Transcript_12021/g.29586 Transcript_12021/m.29586 type:complete len:410 (-) Transcript_12021:336-1565(-)|eukprot:CAMPEP_0114521374 /NCGR_PEP_ID=MMETSP0109-20121206/20150_1 /TAXON_ID=29199 /ORGANISM="Chlorarachnion reptans, Strain CCCM449" /LENGTH=409 /DNA_ID=CAMNT_0001702471 /DNA_START=209 /DNA_END=1438 /DNA_ORIENTATION=-